MCALFLAIKWRLFLWIFYSNLCFVIMYLYFFLFQCSANQVHIHASDKICLLSFGWNNGIKTLHGLFNPLILFLSDRKTNFTLHVNFSTLKWDVTEWRFLDRYHDRKWFSISSLFVIKYFHAQKITMHFHTPLFFNYSGVKEIMMDYDRELKTKMKASQQGSTDRTPPIDL